MKLKIFAAFTAACIMAVGLYGQAEEVVTLLGEDYFLSYTNNSTIADMSAYLIEHEGALEVEDNMAVGLWSAGEADMSKVINNDNVNCLNLDTAGDVVTNALYANGELNDSIATKGKAVITANMLMVPSDEIESSFVDAYAPISPEWGIVDNGDLKFGLYAYEYDVTKTVDGVEVVDVVTNLVIYHSYYDTPYELEGGELATPVGYTNYVYEVPSNTDFTQPQAIKITLMQAKTEELFFKVTLNDIDVVTPYGCAEATIVNCLDELPYRDGGPWLRCVNVNNGNVNSISAINFSGTGTINGLTAGIIDANGEGGEGGDYTEEVILSWNDFAGFADTTVGETATAEVTFNLENANEANVTIAGDPEFAAIADQSTLGKVTVTFAPTEAKKYTAILTVTAGGKSATLEITGTGVAPEPTVISVVKLSSTSSKVGSDPTFTAIVTDSEGNPIDAANYTIDTSAINTNKAGLYPVVITATGDDFQGVITNYYAVMNLTWFNGTPTQKAVLTNAYVGVNANADDVDYGSEGSHWMSKSENDRYLAVNHCSANNNAKKVALYELATLKSIYGLCYSHWEVALGTATGSKGVAVSEAAGLVTLGNPHVYNEAPVTTNTTYAIAEVASQVFGANQAYVFVKNGAPVQLKHDSLAFSTDGNYIYFNTYNPSSSRNIICKYSVDKANNQFVWVQDYVGSVSRIRSLELYAIGGRDYVFYGEGGGNLTGNIYAMDTVTGVSTLVCSASESAVFANDGNSEVQLVRISGITSGEMYLYAHSDLGTIVVWALRHDTATGAWKTALVREFTQAEYLALIDKPDLSNSRNLEVSDDNQYGFIVPHYTGDARLIVVTDESLARRKALTLATLKPAGSNKGVALGEITAAVIDENGATVAASEYTITTNLIDITTVGEYTVTITPVEGSVYSNAVTAVYTISEAPAAGFNYPEGGAIDDAAVVDWLTSKGATQAQINALGSVAALNEKYLLNLDLEGSSYTLKIKSLTVVGEDVKVEVELVRANGGVAVTAPINGKLQLWGTADLGVDFANCGLSEISNADFSDGTTAVKSFTPATGVKFFKAVIANPTAAE